MYVIVTYDVNKKRVAKVMKISRKYLRHVQKSVFEGMITEGKLSNLKREIARAINSDEDRVCIYEFDTIKYLKKEQIGVVENIDNII